MMVSRATSKTNLDLTPMMATSDHYLDARSDLDTQEILMSNQGTGMNYLRVYKT